MITTIKFNFPKKRDIRVLEEVYARPEAQHKADESKEGVISGITKVFSSKKAAWLLTDYFLRYEPFWHVSGESFFEYIRKSQFQVEVKPEVRSVIMNKKVIHVDEGKPVCIFDGDEHCFEKYDQDLLIKAWANGKDKDELKPYLEAKANPIKDIDDLEKKDTDIVPVQTRASFLVAEMIKSLLKSVQADKIIDERVDIKKLALYFRPVHVFNYTESESGKMKTIEVDGVTGDVSKPSHLVQRLKGAKPSEETLFDVGSELIDAVIPGVGLSAFIGKKLIKRHRQKKAKKNMELAKAAEAYKGKK